MAETFSCSAELTYRRVSLWLASLLTLAGVLPLAFSTSVFGLGYAGPLLQLAGTVALVLWLRGAWRVKKKGRIEVDPSGLILSGERVIPREVIASAYVLGGQEPTARIVRKRFRGFPVDVRVKTDEEARAVVDALGLGVSSSMAAFDVIPGGLQATVIASMLAIVATALVGALLMVTVGTIGEALPLVAIALIAVSMRLTRGQVHVGTDGLLVARFGSKTFLPFGEIEHIEHDGAAIVVARRGGPALRFGFGGNSPASREATSALARRIDEARAAFERGEAGASAEAQLERGRRSPRQWMQGLRRLVEASSYRDAATLPERLYRIVEDPSVAEATRAGAAVALGPVLDAAGRARLRVAAESTASPKLRVALERAGEDGVEVEAIEEALASLEPDASRPTSPS